MRRALGIVAALTLLPSGPACAQELHGLLSSSFSATQSKSSEGTTAEFQNLRETFDANWSSRLSPTLGYRLTLRGERVDGTSVLSSGDVETRTDTSSVLLQPALDVTLAAAPYSLNVGLRLRDQFTEDSSGGAVTLSEQNTFLRFFYSPDQLPSIGVLMDRTTSTDDRSPAPKDEEETRYQVVTQYSLGGLNLGYTFGRRVHEDRREERATTQDTSVGTVGYAGRFFDDRLSAQADLSLNQTTTVDEFFVAGTARLDRALARGLRADPDPTPTSSADVPLVNEPALVSGTANVPLVLLSSVGFGLAASEQVTELAIALAPEPPFTLPANLTAFLTFRVFFTDDPTLVTWTEVGGVSQAWDPVLSRFTLTVPATTARFFKAYVSRNDFGVLVKATGIAAPVTTAVTAGSERSRSTSGVTIGTGLAYTPVKWLTAAYNANLSTTSQEPESIESRSGTQTFSLTVRPHEKVTTTGTLQYGFSESNQTGAQDTTQTSYSLSVGWVPLKTLSTTLAVARNEDRIARELQNRTDAASVGAASKVFPGLNLDSSYSISRAENFVSTQEVFAQDLAFKMTAQATPWASMVGNYGIQVRETTPPPAGAEPRTVTHTVGGGTVYTLSRLVNFTTRFDFVSTPDGTSFSQQYKMDWVPTSKTSFFVSYFTTNAQFEDVETTSDTINLNGRWSVNRALDLSANYSFSRSTTGDTVQEIQSFNVTASLRF
jgi:hypothetical protein